jgi:hypothetical protein
VRCLIDERANVAPTWFPGQNAADRGHRHNRVAWAKSFSELFDELKEISGLASDPMVPKACLSADRN